MHLDIAFGGGGGVFLFSLQSNKILTKLTRRTKWITFFFKLEKGGNRKKIPIFSSRDKNFSQKKKIFTTVFGKFVRIAKV